MKPAALPLLALLAGFASAQEAISVLYVIQNLQQRVLALENRIL